MPKLMCGITGFLTPSGSLQNARDVLEKMTSTLEHRGPDDSGVWLSEGNRVGLGHRRLSIIDLSKQGSQPMHSACGRFCIVFNGEIYNFISLRKQLEEKGHSLRSHSDTEVLLASVTQWGICEALKRFNGMFAFAIWDCKEKVLFLARDRIGEKPLYYGWAGKIFLFGSELKALRAHPDFKAEMDQDALALYLLHSYIPEPYSIYQGVHKLPRGHLLSVSFDNKSTLKPIPYWSVHEVVENGVKNPFEGSPKEAVSHLESLLTDAVQMRMTADVPVGAFLSGGVDSSTIVALMQSQSSSPVKTFSIGFDERNFDEATYAKTVAKYLGTDHTELYITPAQALSATEQLATLYDEPLADPSQIPTFLISKLARQQVTISLSGDGGDELFGGYERYRSAPSTWRKVQWLPIPVRHAVARLLKNYSSTYKFHTLADILSMPHPDYLYDKLMCAWINPNKILLKNKEVPSSNRMDSSWLPHFAQRMMFYDLTGYLADEILAKVDRASMGVSLEMRMPLLDHRIIEFAWKIPISMKINSKEGKWLLKQILYKHIPRDLIHRPKMGFSFPIAPWLKNHLKDWAEELLSEKRLKSEGIFDPEPIRAKWREHLSGKRNWDSCLWNILMFQTWRQKWMHF